MAIGRNEITIIIILLVAIVILLAVVEFFKKNIQISDAKAFIIEDLQNKYQGADIVIITTNEKFNDKNEQYYEIKAKVTVKQGSPCPERIHIYYNYPEQNFVPKTPEYITKNCAVCKETQCNLVFPEEALIASHMFAGTEEVHAYVTTYNKDIYGTATTEGTSSWIVLWSSPSASYDFKVELSQNGKVISVKKLFKKK